MLYLGHLFGKTTCVQGGRVFPCRFWMADLSLPWAIPKLSVCLYWPFGYSLTALVFGRRVAKRG